MGYIVDFSERVILVEVKNSKGEFEVLQGIFYRDAIDFGIIIPKPSIDILEGKLDLVTISSATLTRELEFKIGEEFHSKKTILDDGKIIYIPLEDYIKFDNNIAYHPEKVYSKEELKSGLRYYTQLDLCQSPIYTQNFLTVGLFSYLRGLSQKVVISQFYHHCISTPPNNLMIIPEIGLQNGGSILERVIDQNGCILNQRISGIVVAYHNKEYNSLGVYISSKQILELVASL